MTLYIEPRYQAIDDNGDPLNGGKLYFYTAGTSTPKDSYSDSALTTPNANPVVADSAGRFGAIYLSGTYKVVLKDSSDVTIWTADNVTGTSSAAGDLLSTNNLSDVGTAATALSNIGGIGAATTDTLTNKTLDADGTGNVVTNIGSSEVKSELISGQTEVTVAAGDSILLGDADDSGNLKRDSVQGILDLVSAGGFTLGTEQSTTSGSSVTFSGIPSGTTMIVIMFEGVSLTSDGVQFTVTIGDAGGLETSGYLSTGSDVQPTSSVSASSSTSAFIIKGSNSGSGAIHGAMTLSLKDAANFTWVENHIMKQRTTDTLIGGGSKSLSAELTQLSIGGGTFDAGSINIMYM